MKARCASACPVLIALKLDKLGQAGDQSSDFLSLIVGQPLVRDSNGVRGLAVYMGQRQAIGINDPIATRDRLKSPGSGKAALRHGCEDKLRRRWRRMQTRRI